MLKLTGLLFLLTVSSNAFATGGFYCRGEFTIKGLSMPVSINATTGRTYGSPILNGGMDLTVGKNETIVPTEQIVNYWNYKNSFKVLVLDEQFDQEKLILEYNIETNRGIFTFSYQGTKYTTKKVSCEFE